MTEPELPERVADRYQIHAALGHGGMARVYRATDALSGREVALKQLLVPQDAGQAAAVSALFEREYRTLARLEHPRVIAVYDFGRDAGGPYYTMELLDGGDLRDRAPVPWRELCALLFDVCSSLALLHSRGLLHRDISPRNVRCTHDGRAKLIDFGALLPLGASGAQVVGTPAFTAPETLHRSALDARTDLFSLGATAYFALTGQLPYPARTFAEVRAAWAVRPLPPSTRVPGIPHALDDLVLSLLHLERGLRPHGAFEVMQRMAAIAGLDCAESSEVSRAYLATPTLVGRDALLAELRERIAGSGEGHGGGILVSAPPGMGRSRVLDACALEATTQGVLVLRAAASGSQAPFALLRTLLADLATAQPRCTTAERYPELFEPGASELQLRDFAQSGADAEALQQAICRLLLTLSRDQTLLLAIDDVQRIDPMSASVLAALIDRARRGSLLVLLTAVDDGAPAGLALRTLAGRSQLQTLQPLTRDDTRALLCSLFGDVANIAVLSDEIHAVAAGNPRMCMDLAEQLVARDVIRYAAGTWLVPARLAPGDLPRSGEAAKKQIIARLSPAARELAEAHALAFYELLHAPDYRALRPEADPAQTDQAVAELVSIGALSSDGEAYTFANRLWSLAFASELDPTSTRARHAALAHMYEPQANLAFVHHAFAAGMEEAGLQTVVARHRSYAAGGFDYKAILEQNLSKLIPTYVDAIRAAQRLGHSPRELFELRRWFVGGSLAAVDDKLYWLEAPIWRKQLEHDTGLDLWHADTQGGTHMERLTRTLQAAQARYLATPEAERVYSVEQAIRMLAEYVVFSIAIGARAVDAALLASLPPLLEPFRVLSPLLDAIHQNALATYESQVECRFEVAHARWLAVLKTLDAMGGSEMQHIEAIRNAIAYGLGMMEAQMGLHSAIDYAARLDQDPYQRLSAISLRKIIRLQQGDTAGADKLRRQGEILALQTRAPQMFHTLLLLELMAQAKIGDLAAMQQSIERLKLAAGHNPTIQPALYEAEGSFELVRGDCELARASFERCIALTEPDARGLSKNLTLWVAAHAGRAEALLRLGQTEAARAAAGAALAECDRRGIDSHAYDLVRVLARAEAQLGDHAAASGRLERVIELQLARGASGLSLGLTYEARAEVAIIAEQAEDFAHYARLTAREYRHGAHSPLGARYERLVHEAQRHGFRAAPQLSDFELATVVDAGDTGLGDVHSAVLNVMAGAQRPADRARRALRLLCQTREAPSGHLYGVSDEAVFLTASHGKAEAPVSLLGLVDDYLQQERSRSETMTVFATGALTDDDPAAQPSVHAAGVEYDLLLLSCVVDGTGKIAGVAAIACGEQRVRHAKQGQLLSALANHLLLTGEG